MTKRMRWKSNWAKHDWNRSAGNCAVLHNVTALKGLEEKSVDFVGTHCSLF